MSKHSKMTDVERDLRARIMQEMVDEERDLRVKIMRQELKNMLMDAFMIPDEDVHVALNRSNTVWQRLKSAGDAPPRIVIGRCVYVLVDDLKAWLKAREKTTVTQGQRNNEQHDSHDDDEGANDQPNRTPARASFASGLLAEPPKSR